MLDFERFHDPRKEIRPTLDKDKNNSGQIPLNNLVVHPIFLSSVKFK
jgi:hypothetical protein